MHDYNGRRSRRPTPSEPVEVLGFDSVPEAGEYVRVVENDRTRPPARRTSARIAPQDRGARAPLGQEASRSRTIFDDARGGEIQELNLVLKADVSGSLEAFEDEIAKLPQDEVQVKVIRTGVGGITESDVMLAAASDAVVLGFNVRPVGDARAGRRARGRRDPHLLGHLPRDRRAARRHAGHARARGGRGDASAPSRCARSSAPRGSARSPAATSPTARSRAARKVRLVRDGTVVYDGEIESLRRFNDDVREVAAGFECGIVLQNYQDVKEGDVIEVYETRQVERALS